MPAIFELLPWPCFWLSGNWHRLPQPCLQGTLVKAVSLTLTISVLALPHSMSFQLLWIVPSGTSSHASSFLGRSSRYCPILCLLVPSCCISPSHADLPLKVDQTSKQSRTMVKHRDKTKRCVLHLPVSFLRKTLSSNCSLKPAFLHST